jgi:hypothetical protein
MSGRRNHYLPQLLMRGFKSRQRKKEYYSWIYQSNVQQFEVNIKNIGVEKDYYSLNDSTTIDDRMTTDENYYAKIINSIRIDSTISTSHYNILNNFIVDLYIRSKHIKSEYQHSTQDLVTMFFTNMAEEDMLQNIVNSILPQTIARFTKKFQQDLVKNVGKKKAAEMAPIMKEEIIKRTSDNSFLSNIYNLIKYFIPHMKSIISENIPAIVKDGQLEALHKRYTDNIKPSNLQFTHWELIENDEGNTILGDVGPVFIDRFGKYVPAIWTFGNPEAVLLPISSHQTIKGCNINTQINTDIKNLNYDISKLSNNFFIASKNEINISKLSENIGTSNKYINELSRVTTDWFNRKLH